MANIILPQVDVLNSVSSSAKFLIEQDGEIKRYYVSNLEVDVPTLTELLAQGPMVLSSYQYGNSLPTAGTEGRVFYIPDNTLSLVYPVGAIYLSVDATSPASLFGGTWEQIADGRVLMGTTDGSKVGTTIEAGLPNITGSIRPDVSSGGFPLIVTSNTGAFTTTSTTGFGIKDTTYIAAGSAGYNTSGIVLDASRSSSIYGNSATVQPPALYVYMWKRIA